MDIPRILFSDLKTGGSSSVVETRLLRFWEVKSPIRGGELMRVDMILIDADSTMMQASINVPKLSKYRGRLAAGTMFSLAGFDVVLSKQTRMTTDSTLLIRFNGTTVFDVITEPHSPIPKEAFRFRNETDLLSLANTNSQFPDIVAELTAVKSTVSDPPKGKNHVMATIKFDNGNPIILSLFDNQAIDFHRSIESMRVDPRVIVATHVNPRYVGARLFLNATTGTHIYFDNETNAGRTYVNRHAGLTPAAPLLREVAKVEPVSISELNSFVIPAVSEDIEFMCTGRVIQVNSDKGWCYISCSKCSRNIQRIGSIFSCVRCSNPHAVGALRYRVELAIADNTAECIFVCFDGVMTKLHGIKADEAGQTMAEQGVNPEDSDMPPFVTDMVGKTYTFTVQLTTYDFSAAHQSFIVTRILEEHDRLPLPVFVLTDHGGDNGGNMECIQKALAKVDSASSSAEAVKEPVGSVLMEMDNPSTHVHGEARIV